MHAIAQPTAGARVPDAGAELFLGRQPILDRGWNLFAFELLFRAGRENSARFSDEIQATAAVIVNAFGELGVESVLGAYRGFINLSEPLLMSDMIECLPRDKVVLEVLETVRPTPRVIARCGELRAAGFLLALDDIAVADAAYEPLLPLIAYVKVDLKQVAPGKLPELVRSFRSWNVGLLAEKVDTREQAAECHALGFQYFQGYFFARPEVLAGRKIHPSEMTLMKLLGLVLADGDQSAIEQTLKRDAGLTVNLLRLVNSVACGTRRRIATLGGAIMLLGRRQLQRWLQLLLYTNGSGAADFPSPLMQLAATRGRLMELLAAAAGVKGVSEDLAFLTGIMSLLDALLKQPLADIVALLPVATEVKAALLAREGALGGMLLLCERLEQGEPDQIAAAIAALPGLSAGRVNAAQAEALRWANSIADPAA